MFRGVKKRLFYVSYPQDNGDSLSYEMFLDFAYMFKPKKVFRDHKKVGFLHF